MRKLLIAVCVLVMPCALWAQNKQTDWGNLSILQSGQKIQVTDASHKKFSGTFSSFSDQSIVIHGENGDQTIPRASVLRVAVRGHRLRNMAIGMAIGAGAGAGIGAAAHNSNCPSNSCIGLTRGDGVALTAALGFVGGAIVGVLIPGHETIYRAAP